MHTNQATPQIEVLTSVEVVDRAIQHGESFRTLCGTYYVDFYSDFFVVSCPLRDGALKSTVCDSEEFRASYHDTLWTPYRAQA